MSFTIRVTREFKSGLLGFLAGCMFVLSIPFLWIGFVGKVELIACIGGLFYFCCSLIVLKLAMTENRSRRKEKVKGE